MARHNTEQQRQEDRGIGGCEQLLEAGKGIGNIVPFLGGSLPFGCLGLAYKGPHVCYFALNFYLPSLSVFSSLTSSHFCRSFIKLCISFCWSFTPITLSSLSSPVFCHQMRSRSQGECLLLWLPFPSLPLSSPDMHVCALLNNHISDLEVLVACA